MEFDLDQNWHSSRFAAFDLETTGTDTDNDRIIEIGLVVFDNGEVVDRYEQLVNPERDIPDEVAAITGISNDDVKDAPPLREVLDELIRRVTDQVLLAYNHEFDLGILRSELARHDRHNVDLPPCLDPFPLAWEYLKDQGLIPNAQLGTVAEYMRIPLDTAHRAVHDAEATGHIMLKFPDFAVLPDKLGALLQLQRALVQKVNEAFARFRRGRDDGRSVLYGGELVIELGAAYVYGDETDPIRALFQRIPDVRDI